MPVSLLGLALICSGLVVILTALCLRLYALLVAERRRNACHNPPPVCGYTLVRRFGRVWVKEVRLW
ncbi:hypothetical protein [Pedomonas sp. V897]|uniref:hypothetical protein n=1 Tax=Pedomonas sp. V897 TaxID=3446482 RepID=UPI003EDF1906